MRWFRRTPPWAVEYVGRVYREIVADGGGFALTADQLNIPLSARTQYLEKSLLQREMMCLVALMVILEIDPNSECSAILAAYTRLLERQLASRGIHVEMDLYSASATQEVREMFENPGLWAQRWLAEFQREPGDHSATERFAESCIRQYYSFRKAAQESVGYNLGPREAAP
jgi:hypothetical protein